MAERVNYQVSQAVAEIRLNRPDCLNALDDAAYRALHQAVCRFRDDDKARVLLLCGEGRAFCAGQDLNELPALEGRTKKQARQDLERIQDITRTLLDCGKVSVAVMQGAAVGAGAEIPLACDLRLGTADTFFLFPEVSLGLFQTNGSTALLPRLIGSGRAAEVLLLGQRVTAQQALGWGLLNQLHDSGELLNEARLMADKLASLNPETVAILRQLMQQGFDRSMDEVLEAEIVASLAVPQVPAK